MHGHAKVLELLDLKHFLEYRECGALRGGRGGQGRGESVGYHCRQTQSPKLCIQ